jgi:Tol biopolymer transport system component
MIWTGAFSLGRPGELLYGYANGENRVHALDLASGRETGIGARCDYRVARPRLSPDGLSIAVVWGCGHSRGATLLATLRTDGSHQHVLAPKDTAGAEDPSWSPDGQWLAYTRNDGTAGEGDPHVAVIDTSGRQLRTLVAGRSPEWSPTGEWIAYAEALSTPIIGLIRPNGKDGHVVVVSHEGRERNWVSGPFRWSPDGHALVFGRRGVLWQLDIATGAVTQLTSSDGQPEK